MISYKLKYKWINDREGDGQKGSKSQNFTRYRARLMNKQKARVHEPGGGLNFRRDATKTLTYAAGIIELVPEHLELLLQSVNSGRRRRRGATLSACH